MDKTPKVPRRTAEERLRHGRGPGKPAGRRICLILADDPEGRLRLASTQASQAPCANVALAWSRSRPHWMACWMAEATALRAARCSRSICGTRACTSALMAARDFGVRVCSSAYQWPVCAHLQSLLPAYSNGRAEARWGMPVGGPDGNSAAAVCARPMPAALASAPFRERHYVQWPSQSRMHRGAAPRRLGKISATDQSLTDDSSSGLPCI